MTRRPVGGRLSESAHPVAGGDCGLGAPREKFPFDTRHRCSSKSDLPLTDRSSSRPLNVSLS